MRKVFGIEVDVQRVLLVQQDITDYELLPSPVKSKDPRTPAYIERYGFGDVYELDSLKPDVIADRLEKAICRNIDLDLYNTQVEKWEEDKLEIEKFLDAWDARESY